ncbi:MAG: 3-oxoadipyl-CoA thiolase [Bacteroidota bacterium]|jgi:acetyl-CoA acyltransferase
MNAFIVDGVRTGIGNFGGSLAAVRADDLAATVLQALMKRHENLDWKNVADVILGCANQAGEDNRNVARMALLLAGLPQEVPGETVNRLCASGLNAVMNAARVLHANEGDLIIAGGVEHMTRGPWVISKTSSAFGRDAQMFDSSFGWRFINPQMKAVYGTDAMGETAENLAELFNISREDQDAFALWSQQKAAAAGAIHAEEIVPVVIPQKKGEAISFVKDEFARPQSTMEALSGLKPAFRKEGSVTAGNASGLNDGAAALLMASEDGLKRHGLKPLARIVSSAVTGVEPRIMGIGPVSASRLALQRAGLTIDQIDLIELNEAFAAQVLACTRQLGLADNDPRLNPYGGAIALGHPLGMSGARLALTAAKELQRSGKKYALCTMCIGVGQGYAAVLERI